MPTPPVFDLDPADFYRDPYPIMASMRREAPVAWVPTLQSVVFTRHADISVAEKDVATFSSDQPDGLMQKLMGHNMMRKDGKDHMAERKVMLRALSTRQVRDHWKPVFRRTAAAVLAELESKGEFDLVSDYAMPVSAGCLQALTGLVDATAEEFDHWSQAMIDGIANYGGDEAIERRCLDALAAMDEAIDARISYLKRAPERCLLSVMLGADMPLESIRANIRLTISGGQNEPRDAIAGIAWALMTYPEELEKLNSGAVSWDNVFEEYIRWMSPIGMSPRRVTLDATFNGLDLVKDDRVFFLFSSANRDEEVFDNADRFCVDRDASGHLAFGAGPHYCAGAWASKTMISDVALPALFDQFQNIRLSRGSAARFLGWAFRGLPEASVSV